MRRKTFTHKLSFCDNQWEIDAGSIDGYIEGNPVFVYPLDLHQAEREKPLEHLTIEHCQARNATLSQPSNLEADKQYHAVVYNTAYPLSVSFIGDNIGVELLQSALHGEVIPEGVRYFDLIEEVIDAPYSIVATTTEGYQIYKEKRLLFSQKYLDEQSAISIMRRLLFYARWEQLLSNNEESALGEMVDFFIEHRGAVHFRDFLTIDDAINEEPSHHNRYSYHCRGHENESVQLSLLIFDNASQQIYQGFEDSNTTLLEANQEAEGSSFFYFRPEEIRNGIYEKEYFFKLYISEASKDSSVWSSKTIKLNKLYAIPIRTSTTETIELYRGIKVKAHTIPATITLVATKQIMQEKDFPPTVAYKPHASYEEFVSIRVDDFDYEFRESVSEENPFTFLIEGGVEDQIHSYYFEEENYMELDATTSYNNGAVEYSITGFPPYRETAYEYEDSIFIEFYREW